MAATLVAVEMMKHCALWLIAIFLVIVVVLNPIYDTQAAPDCLCFLCQKITRYKSFKIGSFELLSLRPRSPQPMKLGAEI